MLARGYLIISVPIGIGIPEDIDDPDEFGPYSIETVKGILAALNQQPTDASSIVKWDEADFHLAAMEVDV